MAAGSSICTALSYTEELRAFTADAVHVFQPTGSSAQDSFSWRRGLAPLEAHAGRGAPSKSFLMPNSPTQLIAKWSAAKRVRGNLQALLGRSHSNNPSLLIHPSSVHRDELHPVPHVLPVPAPHAAQPAAGEPCWKLVNL